MEKRNLFFKSDFVIMERCEAGYAVPFRFKYWTDSRAKAWEACFDGVTYRGCQLSEDGLTLTVGFDNHGMGVGTLMVERCYYLTNSDYESGICDAVIAPQPVVCVDDDDEEYEVMLALNGVTALGGTSILPPYYQAGKSAYEIAVEEGYEGTEEEWIQSLKQPAEDAAEDAGEAADKANAAAERAETAIADANTATEAANTAASAAQSAATLANEKAQLAANKAALANEKAQLANDKAGLAQQKADYAKEQGDYAKEKGDYAKEQGDYAKEKGDYAKEQGDYAKEQGEAASELQQKLEAGEVVPALAGNLKSWVERGTVPTEDEWAGVVRTSGGDMSIVSSQGMNLVKVKAGVGQFKASSIVTTGYNQLRFATAIGSGYYFLVPAMAFGTFGTAMEPNGILFTSRAGVNLQPTVKFKPLSQGVPSSVADGSACSYVDSNGYRFFTTPAAGYMIVDGIALADTCAKVAWSMRYNDFVAVNDASDGGSTLSLTSIISAIHSYGYMIGVSLGSGFVSDEFEFAGSTCTWRRYCDRVKPTWQTVENEGETVTYTHSATISAMKGNGGCMFADSDIALIVSGTTISYTDENQAASSDWVLYELATPASGSLTVNPHMSLEDFGLEMLSGVEGECYISAQYYMGYDDMLAAIAQIKLKQAVAQIGENEARIAELEAMLDLTGDTVAAAWNEGQSSPDAIDRKGDASVIDYVPVLIDHTRNSVEGSAPVGELRANNYLRYKDGRFAPVVCITDEMYNECMSHELWIDGVKYCDSGKFDAELFYSTYKSVVTVDGVKKFAWPDLRKDAADGDPVSHVLMPWETTSLNYSVMMGHRDTIYMLQNAKGSSGKVWNMLSKSPKQWDGRQATELKPTAISVTTPTNATVDGVRRMRCHFGAFNGSAAAADGYTAGRAGYVSSLFLNTGRKMGECALSYNNASNGYVVHARADNADPTGSLPFAEGGWHEFNAFVAWLEIKYGTRNLAGLFKSGISSNDACSNETQWLQNGGVRCKVAGDNTWEYRTFAQTSAVCFRNNNGVHAATNWSDMLNLSAPKEACMEAQIAASMAMEMGVAEGTEYDCYGETYKWVSLTGTVNLAGGRMNCLVYSRRQGTATGLNAQDVETSFDVEVMMRMSLYEGASLSGDVFNQRNGGFEAVGTHINPVNSGGQIGEHLDFYAQPNQEAWLKNDPTGTGAPGFVFNCEKAYEKVGEHTTIASGYSQADYEGTPFKKTGGAAFATYMAHYVYENNYWSYSAYGVRARLGLRFRGYANYGSCSPRSLIAFSAVGYTNYYYAGSAQVRLASAAPAQLE